MNNFESNYGKILGILKSITEKESFLTQIRAPKLKNIELIALNLTSEYMSIDSECQLFRILPEFYVVKLNVRFITEENENYSLPLNLLGRSSPKDLMNLKTIIL